MTSPHASGDDALSPEGRELVGKFMQTFERFEDAAGLYESAVAVGYVSSDGIAKLRAEKDVAADALRSAVTALVRDLEAANAEADELGRLLQESEGRAVRIAKDVEQAQAHALFAAEQRVAALEAAIRWALGEVGDFAVREYVAQGPYYWRTELRRRASLGVEQSVTEGGTTT